MTSRPEAAEPESPSIGAFVRRQNGLVGARWNDAGHGSDLSPFRKAIVSATVVDGTEFLVAEGAKMIPKKMSCGVRLHRRDVFALLVTLSVVMACDDVRFPPGVDGEPLPSPAEIAAARLETTHATYGEIISVMPCEVTSAVPAGCPLGSRWHDVARVEQNVVENFGSGEEVSGTLTALVAGATAHGVAINESAVGVSGILFSGLSPDELLSNPAEVTLECGVAPGNVIVATDLFDQSRPHDEVRAELRAIEPGPVVEQVALEYFVKVNADAGLACE